MYTLFLRRRAVHGRYVQTLRHPQNEKYTGYIVRREAARGGPSQVLQLAIGCMHRKLGEVRTCYFGDVRADTTNKQTHISHYSALIFHCTRTLVILCCDQFSLTYMQFQHSKLATRCPSLFESSWCFNNRLRPYTGRTALAGTLPPVNNRRILLEKKKFYCLHALADSINAYSAFGLGEEVVYSLHRIQHKIKIKILDDAVEICSWLPPFCKPNLLLFIQPRWQVRTYFFNHYNVLF